MGNGPFAILGEKPYRLPVVESCEGISAPAALAVLRVADAWLL